MGNLFATQGGSGGVDCDHATSRESDILAGKTAGIAGMDELATGTMPNLEAWNGSVAMNNSVTIPQGYHNGSGKVTGPSVTQRGAWGTTIGINGNITIPEGYHNGTGKITQSVPVYGGQTITPSKSQQTINCAGKYASGNVIINPIPSNFTDLTSGRVGFNETAFYSPLDGGVRSMNADSDSRFYGISDGDSMLGKVGKGIYVIVSSNHWNWVVCNHSVNLTDVSRIEVYVIQTGKTKIEIYGLDKGNMVAVADLYRTGTFSVNTSALKGHHYITFVINAFNLTGYNSYASMIKKITFY